MLDRGGNLLDQAVIFPHPPQNRRSEAKVFLKDLVGKHQVGVVAIGNGTACRETEELIAEIIAEGTRFSQPGLAAAASRPQRPNARGRGRPQPARRRTQATARRGRRQPGEPSPAGPEPAPSAGGRLGIRPKRIGGRRSGCSESRAPAENDDGKPSRFPETTSGVRP